jgi:hypothetical protein
MRVVLFILTVSILGGCATQATQGRYAKAGGTQEQFMRDRAECVQQASERRSGMATNGYGGAADSGVIVNCGKWSSCMNARHYQPDPTGELHASWTAAVSCTN